MSPTASTPKIPKADSANGTADFGDDARFDDTFRTFAPRVRGYLRRLTRGDSAEADDVTQEVFLAAHSARATYRGSAPPLAWLLGIARRRWRDRNRGPRREQVEMPENAASSDDPAAQTIRAQHLQGCLNQLSVGERDALMLVFGQGLTYAEAATELGEPIGTVKWRVHAASRKMRELLTAGDEDLQA